MLHVCSVAIAFTMVEKLDGNEFSHLSIWLLRVRYLELIGRTGVRVRGKLEKYIKSLK